MDINSIRTTRFIKGNLGLAIQQILLACALIVLESVALSMTYPPNSDTEIQGDIMSSTGGGVWSGVFFLVAGFIGVIANRTPQNVLITKNRSSVSYLVLSILSSILSCLMTAYSIAAGMMYAMANDMLSTLNTFLGIRIAIAVIFLVLFLLFIISSSFGCRILCVCCRGVGSVNMPVSEHVRMAAFPSGTIIILPNGSRAIVTDTPDPKAFSSDTKNRSRFTEV